MDSVSSSAHSLQKSGIAFCRQNVTETLTYVISNKDVPNAKTALVSYCWLVVLISPHKSPTAPRGVQNHLRFREGIDIVRERA